MQPDDLTETTETAPAGAPETPPAGDQGGAPADGTPEPAEPADDDRREVFDRPYVDKLRKSEAAYRVRAKHAEELGARLVTAYAAATGKLADPTDLAYDAALCDDDGLPDPERVAAAVDALLEAKPHLATRRPVGDVGQGPRPGEQPSVSLAGLLRAGAV